MWIFENGAGFLLRELLRLTVKTPPDENDLIFPVAARLSFMNGVQQEFYMKIMIMLPVHCPENKI